MTLIFARFYKMTFRSHGKLLKFFLMATPLFIQNPLFLINVYFLFIDFVNNSLLLFITVQFIISYPTAIDLCTINV